MSRRFSNHSGIPVVLCAVFSVALCAGAHAQVTCFGFADTDPNVCSGHGTCTAPDTCVCDAGWMGPQCESSQCGDGIIVGAEACDDGDLEDGDGCSSTCTIEDGWSCDGEPSVCTEGVIPTVSQWGLIVISLGILAAGTLVCHRRKPKQA